MDRFFRVEIDKDGSSPAPQRACWRGMHVCMAEGFAYDDKVPVEAKAGEYTIKNAINHEHFSVFRPAYLVLHAQGFPHSVVSQITRHQDSAFLVQSMRYTGDRIANLGKKLIDLEVFNYTDLDNHKDHVQLFNEMWSLFYYRNVGDFYTNRQGKKYVYSDRSYNSLIDKNINACVDYYLDMEEGMSEEHARDGLTYNFRQNFMIAGDLQAVFHLIDQRSKQDSQLEIRQFAELAMDKVKKFAPEFADWYMSKRYGKGRLAP